MTIKVIFVSYVFAIEGPSLLSGAISQCMKLVRLLDWLILFSREEHRVQARSDVLHAGDEYRVHIEMASINSGVLTPIIEKADYNLTDDEHCDEYANRVRQYYDYEVNKYRRPLVY